MPGSGSPYGSPTGACWSGWGRWDGPGAQPTDRNQCVLSLDLHGSIGSTGLGTPTSAASSDYNAILWTSDAHRWVQFSDMTSQVNKWIGWALGTVIAVAFLTAPIHEIDEVETYYTYEPLTYRQTLLRNRQVNRICFPWFCERTEVQYGLQNTADASGLFSVNFVFDNDTSRETNTKTITLYAGEEGSVSMVSSLRGQSRFGVNVIAPQKAMQHERTVTKKVNTLSKLDDLWRLRLLRR